MTDDGGAPLFVSGNSVLSYDPSTLAASANVLADLTGIGAGGFIGASVATNYGGYVFDAGLRFGRLGHDDRRTINSNGAPGGTGVASASYDSTFYSPEVGVSRAMYMGDRMVTPSVRYRYTRQSIDGYTETGTMMNAIVGSRKVTVGQLDLGVDVSTQVGAGLLTGLFGVMHRNVGGDDDVVVTIAGNTNTVGIFGDDQTAASISVSCSQDISNGVSFNIGADAMFGGGNVSGYSIGASLIARF